MRIYINGDPVVISEFDDIRSILEIYSQKLGNDTIPAYFYITNKDYTIEKNAELKVDDLRKKLKKIKLNDQFSENIESLEPYYPLMNDKTYWRFSGKTAIVILYLIVHGITTEEEMGSVNIDIIQSVDKNLSRPAFIKRSIETYKKAVKKQMEAIKQNREDRREIRRKIQNVPQVEAGSYNIDQITIEVPLILPNDENISIIFDSIITSSVVPIAILTLRGKTWIKIHTHANIPNEWLIIEPDRKGQIVDGITFRVANIEIEDIRGSDIDAFYSLVHWSSNNVINFSVNVIGQVNDYNDIKNNFFQAIDPKLKYIQLPDITSNINGTFRVEDINFNRAVMADMVMTNEIFSYFFFANEIDKTVLEKTRFYLYFQHHQDGNIENSMTISITPKKIKSKSWLEVRVSKATSLAEVNSFIYIFSKLMGIYNGEYKSILSLYKSLIGAAEINSYSTAEKELPEDRKSGQKLKLLKSRRPDVFRTNYTCQQNRHPEHKYGHELDEVEGRVMEWPFKSDEYYYCRSKAGFPGLIVNNDSVSKKDFPLVPCCFDTEQMKKTGKGSKYIRYLTEAKRLYSEGERDLQKINYQASKMTVDDIIKERKKGSRPLNQDKFLEIDRRGKLPHYIQLIFESGGYEKVEYKQFDSPSIPILRFGVMGSSSSFIHCLEAAFNDRYLSASEEKRVRIVNKRLKDLSQLDFSYAKQELYDLSENEIKRILTQPNSFIDPCAFVSLAMKYYQCNILMYRVDEDHKSGRVLIPRFAQAYLMRAIDVSIPTVFIIERSVDEPYSYQCEILGKLNPSDDRQLDFLFSDEPVIDKSFQIVQESNQVTIVTPKGAKYYTPVDTHNRLFKNVVSQTVDSYGKCRILHYSNISLVTSPLPPLDLPNTNDYHLAGIDRVLNFISNKKLTITSQDGEEDRIEGVWISEDSHNYGIYYGYIPMKESEVIKSIPYSKEEDPYRTEQTSELQEYQRDQKISDVLRQYTLFEYSKDPDNFGVDSYTVIPDHKYDIDKLNKRLIDDNEVIYSDGKIIVTSEDMIDKLIFYLRVQIINDSPSINTYGKRKIIEGYYQHVDDFISRPDELIFASLKAVSKWKEERTQITQANTVHTTVRPFDIEAYYYRNFNIRNAQLCIVQNVVDGNLFRALSVIDSWNKERVNTGFSPSPIEKDSYTVYHTSGKKKVYGDKNNMTVLNYGDDNYAALLFL